MLMDALIIMNSLPNSPQSKLDPYMFELMIILERVKFES